MREGRCSCGQLNYATDGDPLIVHCCHCSYCQRETGSAFAWNWLVEADNVRFSGQQELVDTPSASGHGQIIIRCAQCHVAVSSHYVAAGKAIHFLRVGTMTDRTGIRPDVQIYTAEKQPWVTLPADIPAFDAIYDPASFWSDETMARVRAARQKAAS